LGTMVTRETRSRGCDNGSDSKSNIELLLSLL